MKSQFDSLLGTGVFNSDGKIFFCSFADFKISPEIQGICGSTSSVFPKGVPANPNRFHRSMTRPYFTRDRISHFDNFDLHSDIALKLASKRLAEGHAIDFQV